MLFDDILEPPIEEQVKSLKEENKDLCQEVLELHQEIDLRHKREGRTKKLFKEAKFVLNKAREKLSDEEWSEITQETDKYMGRATIVEDTDG
jgi:hypothetical protein